MIFQHSIVCLYGSPSKRRFNKHLLQEKNDERNSIPSRIYNVGGGGGGGGGGFGENKERINLCGEKKKKKKKKKEKNILDCNNLKL